MAPQTMNAAPRRTKKARSRFNTAFRSSSRNVKTQLFLGVKMQLQCSSSNAAFSHPWEFDKGWHVTTVCGCVRANICSRTRVRILYTVYSILYTRLKILNCLTISVCTLPQKLIIRIVEAVNIYYIWVSAHTIDTI